MGVWTDRSRRIITQTLEGLPVGATERECRKILSDAYPFGVREHHPYKVWLQECREALKRRFAVRVQEKARPGMPYRLSRRGQRWWLDVRCEWCGMMRVSPCLMCGRKREPIQALVATPDFQAMAANLDSLPALLDFLEENLGERPEVQES